MRFSILFDSAWCRFLVLALVVVAALPHCACADDSSSSGVGGRWRMLKSEHKQVQMVSEQVRMVQQPDEEFLTTADFVFRNHGPAVTVTMGFPEEIYGVDASNRVSMSHFATWVDGRRVVAKRHIISEARDDFGALWVKQVHFGRNATRRVRVRYLSSCGGGDSSGYQWASYDFTGGNWRGKLREAILDIQFLPGWYRFNPLEGGVKDHPEVSRRGGHFRFRWTNWQAQSEFQLTYRTVFPNELSISHPEPFHNPAFLVVQPGKPRLYQGIGTATDCKSAIQWKGHLWIRAQGFDGCQWNEKRRGMIVRYGKRACFIPARGTTHWGAQGPLDCDRSFWVASRNSNQGFYVPARLLAQRLGGAFTTSNGAAIYKNGHHIKRFE